jgi:lipopolysaccharide/colanic/teichoic acid biosynthesis glycosyltransferase
MGLSHPGASTAAFAEPVWLRAIERRHVWLAGRAYHVAKRAMDVSLVIATAPLWAPLLLACAAAVKLSGWNAPVVFRQPRTGRGGHRFLMLKFRTMVPNAEELKKELAHLNELQWPDFKITKDPRITRVGRFLRNTSLDELPQLLNVLNGEMSLVGPRPTSFDAATYRLWQSERLDVVPGITGLWQILGRASTEFDERLRMDIAYIERRCLWLDVQILFRTMTSVLARKGAH